jgi:hypothetical protein
VSKPARVYFNTTPKDEVRPSAGIGRAARRHLTYDGRTVTRRHRADGTTGTQPTLSSRAAATRRRNQIAKVSRRAGR